MVICVFLMMCLFVKMGIIRAGFAGESLKIGFLKNVYDYNFLKRFVRSK